MERTARIILAALLSSCLAACALFGVASAPENQQARHFAYDAIHDLESGNSPGFASHAAPPQHDQFLAQFDQVRQYLPTGPVLKEAVVSSTSMDFTQSGRTIHYDKYTIELTGQHDWALVRCQVATDKTGMVMNAFFVQRMYISYAEFTGFSLKNMTFAKAVIALTGLLGVVLTIAAWIVLYRSRAFTSKWAWAIAIAVSATQINLRWVDGVWDINPFAIQLFQPGVVRMNDGPWMVTVSIPIFAIYVLIGHWRSLQPRPGVYE